MNNQVVIFLEFTSIIITMFSLALIADKFLIPTLTNIAKKYSLSEQVEGILLAIGASIPEFTTNLIASLNDSVDIGIGAIAGSGSYDFTICFGFASLFTIGMTLHAGLYYRDSIIYLLTLALLTYFLIDQEIKLHEAAILTCLWPFYLMISMYKTSDTTEREKNLQSKIKYINGGENTDNRSSIKKNEGPSANNNSEIFLDISNTKASKSTNLSDIDDPTGEHSKKENLHENADDEQFSLIESKLQKDGKKDRPVEEQEINIQKNPVYNYFEDIYEKTGVIYSRCVPLWENSPIMGFSIIMIFIFLHSNLIVFAIQDISDRLQISETFLGMTIISWGGNIGDTINACVAAKINASALISTSILGSQITNLQLCLGFPWLLAIIKRKLQGKQPDIIEFGALGSKTQNNPLYYFVPLLICVLLSMLIFGVFKMKLNKCSGGLLSLVYVLYFTYESYIQAN